MLNIALPLSANPINFWNHRAQENIQMAMTQRPIGPAFKARQVRLGPDRDTPEELIASQKLRDSSPSPFTANKWPTAKPHHTSRASASPGSAIRWPRGRQRTAP